jgi:hypothetical protein
MKLSLRHTRVDHVLIARGSALPFESLDVAGESTDTSTQRFTWLYKKF